MSELSKNVMYESTIDGILFMIQRRTSNKIGRPTEGKTFFAMQH